MKPMLFLSAMIIAAVPTICAAQSANDFVSDAIKGDNSEIALGKMAASKAGAARVRRFGKTLVADHTMARDQASKVAADLHVTVPTDKMSAATDEENKLQSMNGKDFDKEFVRYMVEDHEKDISQFKDEAKKSGPAGNLAKEQLPTLRKHLRMAKSLERKI